MNFLNSLTLVPVPTSEGQPVVFRASLDLGPFDAHNTRIRIDTDVVGGHSHTGALLQCACRQALELLEIVVKAKTT